MILGMSVSSFTLLHVVLSLIGIVFGFLALAELIADKSSSLVSAIFLGFTVATSVTGFLFPGPLDPARIVGIISLVALGIALIARYGRQLARRWRLVYVVTAVLALYLNVFVAVVQAFQKIPALHARAPMDRSRRSWSCSRWCWRRSSSWGLPLPGASAARKVPALAR